MSYRLVAHGAFQGGVFEPSPEYSEQVEVLAFDHPNHLRVDLLP
jgi:hypothetical protein